MIDLTPYIEAYRKEWTRITKLESYKWVAFKHYKEHCTRKFNSEYDKKSYTKRSKKREKTLGVKPTFKDLKGMPKYRSIKKQRSY